MPNYKFLLHDAQVNELKEWEEITQIDVTAIESIKDSLSTTDNRAKIGTSIPTPLARLFTYQTAFRIVNKQNTEAWGIADPNQKKEKLKEIEQSIYGGLVSDCLDLLEWLYTDHDTTLAQGGGLNSNFSFSDVIVMNEQFNFNKNPNSQTNTNHLLAFNQAIKQTANTEYFDENITIREIYYTTTKGKILVGATSPMTLVFLSPSFKDAVQEPQNQISQIHGFSQDVFFDTLSNDCYCSLYSRDPRFIAYLKHITRQITTPSPLKDFIDYITDAYIRKVDYDRLINHPNPCLNIQNHTLGQNLISHIAVRVNNTYTAIPLYHAGNIDAFYTDFELDTTRTQINSENNLLQELFGLDTRPLVLSSTCEWGSSYTRQNDIVTDPNSNFNTQFLITTIDGIRQKVFRNNLDNFSNRRLPVNNQKYPFITDEDIFYDYLIDLDYDIDKSRYHSLNLDNEYNRFLLPIKPFYFKLMGVNFQYTSTKTTIGTDIFLTVSVNVPVTSHGALAREIEFKRTYNLKASNPLIHRADFDIAIMPFFRMQDKSLNNFHKFLICFEKTDGNVNATLNYEKTSLLCYNTVTDYPVSHTPRGDYKDLNLKTAYIDTQQDFRAIHITVQNNNGVTYSGLLVPKFKEIRLNQSGYRFAIDFGTTNTHIEYLRLGTDGQPINQESPHSFKHILNDRNDPNAPLVALVNEYFHDANPFRKADIRKKGLEKCYEILIREAITPYIGEAHTYSNQQGSKQEIVQHHNFPIRTAALSMATLSSTTTKPFLHSNIAFMVGDSFFDDNDASINIGGEITENLKWGLESKAARNQHYRSIIKNFFDQLILLIQYKSLHDGIRKENIELVFSYPISMSPNLKKDIIEIVNKSISFIYNGPLEDGSVSFEISESIAPFHYFTEAASADYYCNIDIGGGTSDLFVQYLDENAIKQKIQDSIRFAGNDLWSVPKNAKTKNGFLLMFENWNQFNKIDDVNYKQKYRNYQSLNSNEGAISYLFKNDSILNFTRDVILRGDFKLVLFVHYAAMMHYMTCVLGSKKNNINLKTNSIALTFSGNASLYIRMLFGNNQDDLNYFTKYLFSRLYNENSLHTKIAGKISESPISTVLIDLNPKEVTAKGASKAFIRRNNNIVQNNPNDAYADEDTGSTENTEAGNIQKEQKEPQNSNEKHYLYKEVNWGNLSQVKEEMTDSNDKFFNSLVSLFADPDIAKSDRWKSRFGDLSTYKHVFSKDKLKGYSTAWANERNQDDPIDKETGHFFKILHYVLYDLSIAIYDNNKISSK